MVEVIGEWLLCNWSVVAAPGPAHVCLLVDCACFCSTYIHVYSIFPTFFVTKKFDGVHRRIVFSAVVTALLRKGYLRV